MNLNKIYQVFYNFIKRRAPALVLGLIGSLIWMFFFGLYHRLPLAAETAWPHGDGKLRLFNYHLGEYLEVRFRDGDKYLDDGLAQARKLLRSRGNAEIIDINPKLFDLVDFLQDHFQADEIEIISGFRDKEFNQKLLAEGHKVSPQSLHTQGQALDIHIDEIREETLRDYLRSLKLGGVGYYAPLDFVHVDTGPVRYWEEAPTARKLIGVMNPQAPVQLTSDKNEYMPGENLLFTWNFSGGQSLEDVGEVRLELFRRGQWTSCEANSDPKKKPGLPSSALLCKSGEKEPSYGKYRWVFKLKGNEEGLSSNEFYLKRQ